MKLEASSDPSWALGVVHAAHPDDVCEIAACWLAGGAGGSHASAHLGLELVALHCAEGWGLMAGGKSPGTTGTVRRGGMKSSSSESNGIMGGVRSNFLISSPGKASKPSLACGVVAVEVGVFMGQGQGRR